MVLDFAKELELPQDHRHCEKCGVVIGPEDGACKNCVDEVIRKDTLN